MCHVDNSCRVGAIDANQVSPVPLVVEIVLVVLLALLLVPIGQLTEVEGGEVVALRDLAAGGGGSVQVVHAAVQGHEVVVALWKMAKNKKWKKKKN